MVPRPIRLAAGPGRPSMQLADGRITAFGAGLAPVGDDTLELDASGTVLAPGLVNAHTHIYSGLAPLGMPPPEVPPENFVQILERVWWRLDRALDADSLRASVRLYAAEALLAGTTTLIDHHESPNFIEGSLDVLADACQELGVRALLCFGATERNFGREEAQRGLAECHRFIEANERPLVRGVVALHASFTVSDETIREAAELCQDLDTVMHVHMAEDGADVEDARERGYPGPLERLVDLGALPPGSIMAHGVFLSADQVRRVQDLGCWLVQNPRSNEGNGVGYPPHLAEISNVALGTDGYPAAMLDEQEALEALAGQHGEPMAAVRRRLNAGQCLASERLKVPRLGRLEVGAPADVGAFEPDGRSVRHLVVDGNLVVRDGQLVRGDLEAIRAEAQRQAERLWERLAAL